MSSFGNVPVESSDSGAGKGLGDLFSGGATRAAQRGESPPSSGGKGLPPEGVTRRVPGAKVVGRGPIPVDGRKFAYDRNRALTMPDLEFEVSRADRMDPAEAGQLLDRIHKLYGIDREPEDVLAAFDKALFFEHTVNGASMLQPGRGKLTIGSAQFELAPIKALLGVDQRRFFRAYADEITDVNREVLASYDPYNPVAVEKYAQLTQVAFARSLQKYPYLAHDSSDAGNRLSMEERHAVQNSKVAVLQSSVNRADATVRRVKESVVEDE